MGAMRIRASVFAGLVVTSSAAAMGCGPSRLSDTDIERYCELLIGCGIGVSLSACVTETRAQRDAINMTGCGGQLGAAARCVIRANSCSPTDACASEQMRLSSCLDRARDAGVSTDARLPPVDANPTESSGLRTSNGYLEVFYMGEWRGVCDDSFDENDALVACRQMGFSGVESYTTTTGTSRFWLDELACTGTEARLDDCPNGGWGVHDCSASECIGLVCF
jgi:hypothetical protein